VQLATAIPLDDDISVMYALYKYIDNTCYRSWVEGKDPAEVNIPKKFLKWMNQQYPDRRSEGHRFKAFLDFAMREHHTLEEYSNRKANLWIICKEGNNTTTAEFFGHWRDGLRPKYREEILRRTHKLTNFKIVYRYLQVIEKARHDVYGFTHQREPSKEECKRYLNGHCPEGNSCQYSHRPGRQGAHKGKSGAHVITAENFSENSEDSDEKLIGGAFQKDRKKKPQPVKVQPTNPCPMCKKKDGVSKHRYFECTNPTRPCTICGGKHTIFLCPNIICTKCDKKGHLHKICDAVKDKRG
jgi:hypothetical protein